MQTTTTAAVQADNGRPANLLNHETDNTVVQQLINDLSAGGGAPWLFRPDSLDRLLHVERTDEPAFVEFMEALRASPFKVASRLKASMDRRRKENARNGQRATHGDWRDGLLCDDNGRAKPLLANASKALRDAPALRGLVAYNEFSLRPCLARKAPWLDGAEFQARDWATEDTLALTTWLQENGVEVNDDTARKAMRLVSADNRFHPIRDYLGGLTWDGVPRVGQWLVTYAGAEDNEFNRAVGRMALIAAVARIYEPGCKVDNMLVLESGQGAGKSALIARLFGQDWTIDRLPDLSSKEALINLRGKWVVEVAELAAFKGRGAEQIKAFLTSPVDVFRPPYGETVESYPRQNVFIGTTNEDQYLDDPTGNRRPWPVKVSEALDVEGIGRDRDQLWAEAVHLYQQGEQWWIPKGSPLWDRATGVQRERVRADAWQEEISEWLDRERPTFVTTRDVLTKALGLELADLRRAEETRIGNIMGSASGLGWVRVQKRLPGFSSPVRGYGPPQSTLDAWAAIDEARRQEEARRDNRRRVPEPVLHDDDF